MVYNLYRSIRFSTLFIYFVLVEFVFFFFFFVISVKRRSETDEADATRHDKDTRRNDD